MSESVVSVSIRADTAALVAGMKDAAAAVDSGAKAMAGGLAAQAGAAQKAEHAHAGLLASLRAFKGEQVQQGKIAKFYAGELTSIIPASAGASGALRGVLGAGIELAAGGGVLAVGFELAKVGIEAFTAKSEESEKHALELRQAYVKATDEIDRSFRGVSQSIAGELSKTSAAWQGEVNKTKDALKDLQNEVAEKTTKAGHSVWAQLKGGLQQITIGNTSGKGVNTGEDDEIAQMQAKQLAMVKALEDAKLAKKRLAGVEQKKIDEQTALEVEAIEAKSAGKVAEIRAALATRLRQLKEQTDKLDPNAGGNRAKLEAAAIAQSAEEIRRVRVDSDLRTNAALLSTQKPFLSAYGAAIRESDQRTAALREQMRRTTDASERAGLQAQVNAEGRVRDQAQRDAIAKYKAGLAEMRRIDTEFAAQKLAQRVQVQQHMEALQEKEVTQFIDAAKTIGDAMGNAFAAMAAGTASLGQAISGVLKSTLQMVLQIAQKEILASALVAAANSAKATSSLGILGVIAMPVAIASALALVGGLVNQLPGFADGGRFSGGPMIVGERGPEVLVPDGGGSIIPNHKLGGLGKGITVNISAIDGPSVLRFVESPVFSKAIREAQRNGRIA